MADNDEVEPLLRDRLSSSEGATFAIDLSDKLVDDICKRRLIDVIK